MSDENAQPIAVQMITKTSEESSHFGPVFNSIKVYDRIRWKTSNGAEVYKCILHTHKNGICGFHSFC